LPFIYDVLVSFKQSLEAGSRSIPALGVSLSLSWRRCKVLNENMVFSLLYNLPLFGLAVYWILCRIQEAKKSRPLAIAIDIIVVALAASRYLGSTILPSGHALFLTHSLLTTANRLYRIIALILLAVTIVLKVSWGDYSSWVYGILVALSSSFLWRYVNKVATVSGEAAGVKGR
jgi:hypothetical protein